MKRFPTEEACIEYIFSKRFPEVRGYKRIPTRRAYVNNYGHQIYPLAGTILEKSRTPITTWFYAMYLYSISKNGVAAKELQRQFGVTYKTAWRMANRIRRLMEQKDRKLTGILEADETYIGGRRRSTAKFKNKSVVMGMVQRGGPVRVQVLKNRGEYQIMPFLERNAKKGAFLFTDEAPVYNIARGYMRGSVRHADYQYADGIIHTNTIEGFWGQLKRSLHGTYHSVSKQHLQAYIDEFAFRYNYRTAPFEELIKRL